MTLSERLLNSSIRDLIDKISATKYQPADGWPSLAEYYNIDEGHYYKPHHEAEEIAFHDAVHRYILVKGGEGGGKSVFGIIRDLERFKRGCNGIVVSPDFEHFKKSLWPEFRRWCPWDMVVPKQRYRAAAHWEPSKPFSLAFITGALGFFGGIEKPISWEGPNVNFAHFDEARKKDDPLALKVLDGRVRIPGPLGDIPQIWITTTPKKHWLYEYFGPIDKREKHLEFKRNSHVLTLLTKDNEIHLEKDFVRKRSMTLTAAEIRVLLEAAWEDYDDVQHFLPNMLLWDRLKDPSMPPLGKNEPAILALDAAVTYDSFGLAVVTRHWLPSKHATHAAIRYIENWRPEKEGGEIVYQQSPEDGRYGPEDRVRWLIDNYNIVQVAFDPAQLYDMSQRLGSYGEALAWFEPFGQTAERLIGDKQFFDMIMAATIAHDGNEILRDHINNSDRKEDDAEHKLRIVKRADSMKIDLAVAAAMGVKRAMELNL